MKNLFKKIALTLCLIMSVVVIPVKAETNENIKNEITQEKLIEIAKKYNIELDFSDQKTKSTQSDFNFKTVEEFENFLTKIQENKAFEMELNINPNLRNYNRYNYRLSWWAPYAGYGTTSLFCWKDVFFDYQYKFVNGKPQFVSVSNISSDTHGISGGGTWTHKYSSYYISTNKSTRDTANISVTGKWFFGVSVGGINAGASWYDTWDCSLRIY